MFLDDMNHSELVLLAQDHDASVHRGLDRSVLYDVILDTYGKKLPPRKVDKVRRMIMGYILDHWAQLNPLLSCPARTKKPTACFQCTDAQAVECALTNAVVFDREGD